MDSFKQWLIKRFLTVNPHWSVKKIKDGFIYESHTNSQDVTSHKKLVCSTSSAIFELNLFPSRPSADLPVNGSIPEFGRWRVTYGEQESVSINREFPNYESALAFYEEIRKKANFSSGPFSWKKCILLVAVLIIAIGAFPTGGAGTSTAVSNTALTETPVPSPTAIVNSEAPKDAQLSAAEFALVKGLKSVISYPNGATPFYVFTDPNCPFCKKQEAEFSAVDKSYKPVIAPLGYKPGSRDLSAAVLCSKDPLSAWKSLLLNGVKPDAKPCDTGYAQVDENMRVFETLRLNSTPTMVTPHGWLLSSAASASDLSIILGKQ